MGRLFQLIDGKSVTARELAYTPNGLTQSATDARGKVTAYAYDGHDRLSRVTYPDTTYEEYTYDDVSNVRFTRARDGSSIERGYDALNRVTARMVPGSGTDGYTYDLVGRIKTAASPAGTVQYAYDTAGRPQSVAFPGARSVGYQLDAAGNTTRLTYPDTTFITYVYDEMNRMTAVKDDAGATLAGYAYDPLSRRTGVALANGAALTAGFDLADRPASLAHAWTGGAANLAYGYDNSGLRTSLNVDDPRFEPILPAPGQQDTFTVNDLNQYATFNGQPLTYNANGALTDDGTNTYTYDSLNRRTTATTPSGAVGYTYDALDRRLSKTVAGTTTHFVYDGNQVIAEYDGSGALLRKYAYGPGIDQPVMMEQAGQRYYYHADALGSVVALTDGTGAIAETYRYEAFGEPEAASSLGNPYMFTGRRYDPETGTYYYRARYYDPELRRFLEPDPIGYVDGMNLYAYVGNSPVNFVDPEGLYSSGGLEEYNNAWSWERGRVVKTKFTTDPLPEWVDTAGQLSVKTVATVGGGVVAVATKDPGKGLVAYGIIEGLVNLAIDKPASLPSIPYSQFQAGVEWFNPPDLNVGAESIIEDIYIPFHMGNYYQPYDTQATRGLVQYLTNQNTHMKKTVPNK